MAMVVSAALKTANRVENAINFIGATVFAFQVCRFSAHTVQRFELFAALFTFIVVKRHPISCWRPLF